MKYFLLSAYAFFAACNNSSTTSNSADTTATASTSTDTVAISIPANNTTCYAYQSANDTVMLTLTGVDQNISGNLAYAYSGKDKNSGTITGTMKGDTLLADYTFMSEGKSSVRQVVFLKKGDSFVEGYGDSKMEGGNMVFKNTGVLKFGSTLALQKRKCSDF